MPIFHYDMLLHAIMCLFLSSWLLSTPLQLVLQVLAGEGVGKVLYGELAPKDEDRIARVQLVCGQGGAQGAPEECAPGPGVELHGRRVGCGCQERCADVPVSWPRRTISTSWVWG